MVFEDSNHSIPVVLQSDTITIPWYCHAPQYIVRHFCKYCFIQYLGESYKNMSNLKYIYILINIFIQQGSIN